MTVRPSHPRAALRGALGLAACLAAAAASPAPVAAKAARKPAPAAAPAPVASAPAAPVPTPAVRPQSAPADGEGPLRLARAQAAWRLGRVLDAARELETLDYTVPAFADAERAAFLLAQARLALGDRAGFERLAAQVAAWPRPGAYARALADEQALLAGSPAVARLLRDGGAARLADDAEGALRLRAAAAALAAGADPRAELGRVPDASTFAPTARDLAARATAERGDTAAAVRAIEQLLAATPGYAPRRELEALLADATLRRGDSRAAFGLWTALDGRWTAERDALRALAAQPRLDSLVALWEADPAASGAPLAGAARAASAAARLGRDHAAPGADAAQALAAFDRGATAAPALLAPPAPADWRAIGRADSLAGSAAADAARAARDAHAERERLASLTRYLGTGRDSLAVRRAELEARLARLGELHRQLDAIDQRLRAVRDSASLRVVRRAAAIVAQCEANARWAAGLDHFWVHGPAPLRAPAGYAGPDGVLAGERALADRLAALAAKLAAEAPAQVAASYARAWRPGVLDRIAREDGEAAAALAWARRVGAAVDSSLAEAARAAHARALEGRAAALAARADSLAQRARSERDGAARRAVQRTLAAMQDEREAIDYGLAASAWAVATSFDGGAAADSGAAATPEAAGWRADAIARLSGYLARHPAGAGRGDARYRLADLLEQDARAAFRTRMAAYVQHPQGAVPVLETAPVIALHRAILRDDPAFPHRDAVLFDLGSLLAELGDAEATRHFRALVDDFPHSAFAQESWLRLADEAFDQQHFADASPLYRAAVQGADTTLRAIALYKLGWTEFHLDRFEAAADAFGEVLDLYAAGRVDARIRLDDDAEVLLVHTLARAGGAPAFAAHFDRTGPRPYEVRLLQALGQHLRQYALLGPAIAADQLLLDRHPLAPEALVAAQRMDGTYVRWNRPAERHAALLANAGRFGPGARWPAAQATDSLRAAGDAFARAATLEVANAHHRAALAGGGDAEWREAARLEEHVLATWPAAPGARALHLQAAESRAALGDPLGALAHADSVFTGRDSLAAAAALGRVAILDAWYERTRPAADPAAPGRDSVARAVLAAGDALLDAFPRDAHAADVRWRQGQLAFAHADFARAAKTFGDFAARHAADTRAPRAATLRADALVRDGDLGRAREAYELALVLARAAHEDSLAARVARAIPATAYREAEARVAADSSDWAAHATRFENVAMRWPEFEHADVAWYRAGLAHFRAGDTRDGARAMAALLAARPASPLARDAVRATAGAWEAAGDTAAAAQGWLEYASRFRTDAQADDAALRAALGFERAGGTARSDSLRRAWIRRHPGDDATVMALLEPMVARALDSVTVARPVSRWLAAGGKRAAAPRTVVADYLARAAAHPELAARALVARVRFLEGEEAAAACAAIALRQPLERTLGARKAALEKTLARYKACVEAGEPTWAHAASFRIGDALTAFGEALERSERPKGLGAADRAAYDDVLHRQRDVFDQRAEGVWAQLLDGRDASADDAWLARARAALQPRLALRARAAEGGDAPSATTEGSPNR